MKKSKEVKKLALTAVLLAIAIVVDLFVNVTPGLNLSMPFGGKFFGISMLPLILIGLTCGLQYGLIAGFVFGIYNFSADYMIYLSTLKDTLESWTGTSWNAGQITLLVLLDYVIPFMAFGLSGLFNKTFSKLSSVIQSVTIVSVVRLISSTLSGVILWSSSIDYAVSAVQAGEADPDIATRIFSAVGGNIWVYSLGYNFTYIFTTGIIVTIFFSLIHKRLFTALEKQIIAV